MWKIGFELVFSCKFHVILFWFNVNLKKNHLNYTKTYRFLHFFHRFRFFFKLITWARVKKKQRKYPVEISWFKKSCFHYSVVCPQYCVNNKKKFGVKIIQMFLIRIYLHVLWEYNFSIIWYSDAIDVKNCSKYQLL